MKTKLNVSTEVENVAEVKLTEKMQRDLHEVHTALENLSAGVEMAGNVLTRLEWTKDDIYAAINPKDNNFNEFGLNQLYTTLELLLDHIGFLQKEIVQHKQEAFNHLDGLLHRNNPSTAMEE
ncbi:hypothetical protein [Jeotgalibacillus soli]|uniref:Uncharacterized protein n=1 Tax=Jeotgalibacillus soli TaxID=889306 RepID=A0A0C2VKP6_9BACL|nr:hypothetical protein [Jeotgalibacillus soli]KIL45001.1 hypothetical protein KP78_25450 [Jeotgalibacillus soli]